MNITVIIPTYNEVDNINKLVPMLATHFKKHSQFNWTVLVVDGNSPDGTAGVVRSLAIDYKFLQVLLENEKGGLGRAYAQGFEYAMAHLSPDVIVEMDADLQHDPEELINLVTPISEGYDYVIGSRFTEGGSIPSNWAPYRKFVSKWGNLFSKLVLGIFRVNDITSGYKASRVSGFVDKIDFNTLLSFGFAYKIDLLFRMHSMGAKIKEVPIQFGLRDRGDSKMEGDNMLQSLKVVLMLRLYHNKSFFKFVIVGFTGLLTDIVLFNTFRFFLSSAISSLSSGLVAMLVTFTFNNFWSFRQNKIASKSRFVSSMIFYYISSYIPILFRSWLVATSVRNFGDTFLTNNISFMLGILIGLVWNFTVYSKIIWKDRKDE